MREQVVFWSEQVGKSYLLGKILPARDILKYSNITTIGLWGRENYDDYSISTRI